MAELRAWLARAGSTGQYEQLALDKDLVAIGWGKLDDLTGLPREQIAEWIREHHTDAGKPKVANWAGQLNAFVHGINPGDLVVLPLKARPMIAIWTIAATTPIARTSSPRPDTADRSPGSARTCPGPQWAKICSTRSGRS